VAKDRSEYVKKWKIENREKYIAGYKKYTAQNKDKKREYDRKRREANRDERLLQKKEYYRANKEKHNEYKKRNKAYYDEYMKRWRLENKKEINRKRRIYIHNKLNTDNDFAIKSIFRTCFRRMVSKGFTWRKFLDATGFSLDDYILHFTNNYKHEFHKYKNTHNYHVDHIIPVSAYDFSIDEDIKNCWNPRNLRIIEAQENMKKGGIVDIDIIIKYNVIDLMPKGWGING
jgi:hypothetical protein